MISSSSPTRRQRASSSFESSDEPQKISLSSQSNRAGLFIFSALYTLLFAGAFVGWGPMQLLLEENGFFADRCTTLTTDLVSEQQQHNMDTDATTSLNDELTSSSSSCPEQNNALMDIPIIAIALTALAPLLGYLTDRFGALALMYFMSSCCCAGICLLLVACLTNTDELLFIAFGLIGLLLVSTSIMIVQTGLVYQGDAQRQVISILNTLLGAGAVTYLGLYKLKEVFGLSMTVITGMYLLLAVVCFGGAIYYWKLVIDDVETKVITPASVVNEEEQQKHVSEVKKKVVEVHRLSSISSAARHSFVTHGREERPFRSKLLESVIDLGEKVSIPPAGGSLSNSVRSAGGSLATNSTKNRYVLIARRTPAEQLLSGQFVALVLFFLLHDARTAFVAVTARDFLANLGDNETGNHYLSLFILINPMSIFIQPLVEQMLSAYGYYVGFQITNALSMIHGIIQVTSHNLNVQVIGFIVFSIYRCLAFSAIYSYLPVFLGGNVVGKGVGSMAFVSGLFQLNNIVLKNLSTDFVLANMIYVMGLIPILGILPAWRIQRGMKWEEEASQFEPEVAVRREHSTVLKLNQRVTLIATPITTDSTRRVSKIEFVSSTEGDLVSSYIELASDLPGDESENMDGSTVDGENNSVLAEEVHRLEKEVISLMAPSLRTSFLVDTWDIHAKESDDNDDVEVTVSERKPLVKAVKDYLRGQV